MNKVAKSLALSTRVTLITGAVVVAAMLSGIASNGYLQFRMQRAQTLQTTQNLASMVASNVEAALVFADKRGASDLLKTLQAIPEIEYAALFDKDQNLLVDYAADPRYKPIPSAALFHVGELRELRSHRAVIYQAREGSWQERLWVAEPISYEGEQIGFLVLVHGQQPLYAALLHWLWTALALALSLTAVALLLAGVLQRKATQPLRDLLSVMRTVSESGNYSLRAPIIRADEIGDLVSGFNRMLDRIEAQDRSLQSSHDHLESQVGERTQALTKTNAELEHTIEQLSIAKDASEAASRAKSDFLATMSHEIRTPMNGIMGMAELLQRSSLNDRQISYVDAVYSSAQTLLALINDILDFSKIEAGKMQLTAEPFDLRALVEDTALLHLESMQRKNIELLVSIPLIWPERLNADHQRLRQVISNLIGNAVKFTERGTVSISAALSPSTETHLELELVVEDTGIGIELAQQERIFRAFEQADSSTTNRYGGTGLGLAISSDLIKLFDGKIGVESELGRGSRFWIRVPLQRVDAVPTMPPFDGRRMKVAVIAGASRYRTLLDDLLQSAGVALEVFDEPATALINMKDAAATGSAFNAAIVDLELQDRAEQLVWNIRGDAVLRKLQMVALGAANEVASPLFDRQLNRPIISSQLLACCVSVLAESDTPESPPRQGMRVLMVEDNPTNQAVMRAMLESMDINADLVTDGAAAVEAVKSQTYDLVLMDMRMAVMDGLEATRRIRKLPVSPRIIAVTANAIVGDRERCLAAGMDDYLSKPIGFSGLKAAIERWLPGVGEE